MMSQNPSFCCICDKKGSYFRFSRAIAHEIGFVLADYRHERDIATAFTYLRQKVESAGIFFIPYW